MGKAYGVLGGFVLLAGILLVLLNRTDAAICGGVLRNVSDACSTTQMLTLMGYFCIVAGIALLLMMIAWEK